MVNDSDFFGNNSFEQIIDRYDSYSNPNFLKNIISRTEISVGTSPIKLDNVVPSNYTNTGFWNLYPHIHHINTSSVLYPMYNSENNTLDILKYSVTTNTLSTEYSYTADDLSLSSFSTSRNGFAIVGNILYFVPFNKDKYIKINLEDGSTDAVAFLNAGCYSQFLFATDTRLSVVREVEDKGDYLRFHIITFSLADDSVVGEFFKDSDTNSNLACGHNYYNTIRRGNVDNYFFIRCYEYYNGGKYFWVNAETGLEETPTNTSYTNVGFNIVDSTTIITTDKIVNADTLTPDISTDLIRSDSCAYVTKDFCIDVPNAKIQFFRLRDKKIKVEVV